MSENVEIIVSARDQSRSTFDALRLRLDELSRKVATPSIGLNADGLDTKRLEVLKKLQALNDKVVTASADLNDKALNVAYAEISQKLDRLSKRAVSARISLDGVDKVLLEAGKVDLALDRIDGRRVRATVEVRQSFGSRLRGLFSGGGGGGDSFALRLAGLFGGGGGGSAASSAASGGGGLGAAAGPAGMGAAILGAALLAPGAVGLGLGAVGGGSLFAGGLFGASEGTKILKADTANITTITTGLKTAIGRQKQQLSQALVAANKQYAKDSKFYAPFMGLQLSLKGIAQTVLAPLRPVMAPLIGIIKDFSKGLKTLGPDMTAFFKASLPFVSAFAGVLLKMGKTLLPAFTQALNTMVKSGALKLMTQGLVILIQGFARFIVAMGPGMKASAQIFVDVSKIIALTLQGLGKAISWLANVFNSYFHIVRERLKQWRTDWDGARHMIATVFDGIRHDIAAAWNATWNNTIGRLRRGIADDQKLMGQLRHDIATAFDRIRHDIASIWDMIWNNTIGRLRRGIADEQRLIGNLRHSIASEFDRIRHEIASIWDSVWNNTVGRVRRGVGDVLSWVGKLPGRIKNFFFGAGHWLTSAGRNTIQGLWDGMSVIWHKVTSWISGLAGWIKKHKGPVSFDKQLLVPAGKALMSGLHTGLLSGFAKGPMGFISGLAGTIGGLLSQGVSGLFRGGNAGGSGVARWGGLVSRALGMLGLSQRLKGNVLYQMMTESGGNPFAVNLTDINARMGDPSKGLMQVIGTTFNAYAGPFRRLGQYNPFANIYAALNYARHRYGPSLMSGGMGIGSGHGYAGGGAAGGWAMVGEHGRELVRLPQGSNVRSNSDTERMMSGGSRVSVVLEVSTSGQHEFDRFMGNWIQKFVRVKGGGNVQTAFGQPA